MAEGLKRKAKAEQAAKAALAEQVDEYGILQVDLEKVEAQIQSRTKALQQKANGIGDQMAELRRDIMESVESWADTEDGAILGAVYEARIGAKALKRKLVDIEKLVECLGQENFLKIAKVNLKDVDDYLTPGQRADCIDSANSGPRSFKVKARNGK
jgi:hypothetical protein